MEGRSSSGFLKHLDFFILDVICLQASYFLSFWAVLSANYPFEEKHRDEAVLLFICQLAVMYFEQPFKNILKRGIVMDMRRAFSHVCVVMLSNILLLYVLHRGYDISRLLLGMTAVLYFILSFAARSALKAALLKKRNGSHRSVFVVTRPELADRMAEQLTEFPFGDAGIVGMYLKGGYGAGGIAEVPGRTVFFSEDEAATFVQKSSVDEVFIHLPGETGERERLTGLFMGMGVTVRTVVYELDRDRGWDVYAYKMGGFIIAASALRMVPSWKLFIKRCMDVVGGIAGCLAAAVLCLFVGPAIYFSSPGPIFFSQIRIGKNGKPFRLYKFRSMYLDAEERKKALMEKSQYADGRMFKITDDPRIIGSGKKRRDGSPGGIGNFIRRTSIDEFPQFWNVLKGDMSLVGTRPPTPDEWEKYDPHHRARMSVMPGITGMWQVSGRSRVRSFEDVVRLDTQYIEDWSLWLDIRILARTVAVVLKREGAS